MKSVMTRCWWMIVCAATVQASVAAPPPAPATIARTPYLGAIAIDAATGDVLKEDRADERGNPASMLKLMTLYVVLDAIHSGEIGTNDLVKVSAEVTRMGGSQVFLAEHEEFTVEELIYATMVQSANDAALALALHTAGSRDAFVERMNRKARELKLNRTVFHSMHGLPPGEDQVADWTSARDFARLCHRLLADHPGVLTYTATRERAFRPAQPFIMRNHNRLLFSFEGCDGLKTGYYRAAGYSVAATAQRDGVRAIVVILGSADRKERDTQAQAWMTDALNRLRAARAAKPAAPALPAPAPVTP